MKSIKTSWVALVMLSLILMVPTLKPSNIKAAEPNTTDRVFSFNLYSTSAAYAVTSYENKNDSSSVYVYSESMTNTLNSVYAKAYGSDYTSGYLSVDRTLYGRNYYYTGTNISRELLNTVYEEGDRYAALAARGRTGIGTATGLWSPDTGGNYEPMSYE